MRRCKRLLVVLMWLQAYSAAPYVYAGDASILGDVTMDVIGLDEVPQDVMENISLPRPAEGGRSVLKQTQNDGQNVGITRQNENNTTHGLPPSQTPVPVTTSVTGNNNGDAPLANKDDQDLPHDSRSGHVIIPADAIPAIGLPVDDVPWIPETLENSPTPVHDEHEFPDLIEDDPSLPGLPPEDLLPQEPLLPGGEVPVPTDDIAPPR